MATLTEYLCDITEELIDHGYCGSCSYCAQDGYCKVGHDIFHPACPLSEIIEELSKKTDEIQKQLEDFINAEPITAEDCADEGDYARECKTYGE